MLFVTWKVTTYIWRRNISVRWFSAAFVPFRLILPLSQQPDTVSVAGYGYGADLTDPEVQKELNQFKPPLPESSAVSENPPATPAPTAEGWDGLGMLPPALPLSPMQRQYPNLDSSLISAIVKYETAAPGTAGQPAHPPPLAGLYIYTDTPERVDELRQFLEHNGATNITCGKGSGADVIHSGCGADRAGIAAAPAGGTARRSEN